MDPRIDAAMRSIVAGLRAVSFPLPVASAGLSAGDPIALLPLVSWGLLSCSSAVRARACGLLVEGIGGGGGGGGTTTDADARARSLDDAGLVALALRFSREVLRERPALSAAQFLAPPGAFVLHKLAFVAAVLRGAARLHGEARARAPRRRSAVAAAVPGAAERGEPPLAREPAGAQTAAPCVAAGQLPPSPRASAGQLPPSPRAPAQAAAAFQPPAPAAEPPIAAADASQASAASFRNLPDAGLQRLIAQMEERGRRTAELLARAVPLLEQSWAAERTRRGASG